MTTDSGELRIVAYHDLGAKGSVESAPTTVTWSVRYSMPSLVPVVLVPLLLVLLALSRSNRRPQAWLIIIPPALVMTLLRMLLRLLSAPEEGAEMFTLIVDSLVIGWAVVWLVGQRLSARRWPEAVLLALIMMVAVGLASYLVRFGLTADQDFLPLAVLFALGSLCLVCATALAGWSCRRRYTTSRLMVALLLWMVAGTFLAAMCTALLLAILQANGPQDVIEVSVVMAMVSPIAGGMLYLINVPFMVLATHSPFYQERLRCVLRLPEKDAPWDDVHGEALPTWQPAASTEPTGKPVTTDDVVGRWQFYMDRLSKTVAVDFRPDGTFTQTMLPNQGEAIVCPGGKWALDGPRLTLNGYVAADGGETRSAAWWMVDTPTGLAVYGGDDGEEAARFVMSRESISQN